MSLRDTILAAKDLATELVPAKAWGVPAILLQEFSGAERDLCMETVPTNDEGRYKIRDLWAVAIAVCARDPETGEKIFEPGDWEEIARKSSREVARIGTIALELSDLHPRAIEESEKNSGGGTPSESSTTSSQ